MLLATCFLLFASFNRDRRGQIANSEQQEANKSQTQWEDGASLIHKSIFNP